MVDVYKVVSGDQVEAYFSEDRALARMNTLNVVAESFLDYCTIVEIRDACDLAVEINVPGAVLEMCKLIETRDTERLEDPDELSWYGKSIWNYICPEDVEQFKAYERYSALSADNIGDAREVAPTEICSPLPH